MKYKYFIYSECEYFSECHNGEEKNCLFCFCPLYYFTECPGTPEITDCGIRDCRNCFYPHKKENYEEIIAILKEYNEKLARGPFSPANKKGGVKCGGA